jgi:hypothetical protein
VLSISILDDVQASCGRGALTGYRLNLVAAIASISF